MAISKSRRGAFACVNQSRICRRDLEIVISRISWHIKSRWCVFHSRAARRIALRRDALHSRRRPSGTARSRRDLGTSRKGWRKAGRVLRLCPAPEEARRSSNSAWTTRARTRRYYGYFSSRLTRYYRGCDSLPPAHRPTKVCIVLRYDWSRIARDPLNKCVPSVTNKYPISS